MPEIHEIKKSFCIKEEYYSNISKAKKYKVLKGFITVENEIYIAFHPPMYQNKEMYEQEANERKFKRSTIDKNLKLFEDVESKFL